MKVTQFETWLCKRNEKLFDETRTGKSPYPWDVVVLRLTADNGLQGITTALAARSGNITCSYLNELIAPVILGRDAYDREAIWYEMWDLDRYVTFFPIYLPGPVDIALWDMASKAAGLPLYKYIGAYRTSLPVYASGLYWSEIEDYINEAKEYASKGITAYKVHCPGDWRTDMELHAALREALGEEAILITDPVGDYTLGQAIEVGRELERQKYHWFEEPFRDFELDKYSRLSSALDIPVAGTETTRGAHWGVTQAIVQRAVDIVRADVSWKAGITGTLKIAHLADAHGLQCEIHSAMGPTDMANLHVACAIRNCEFFELIIPEEPFRFPMKNPYPIDDKGMIHVPQTPGIGMDLDWDLIDNTCTDHQVQRT